MAKPRLHGGVVLRKIWEIGQHGPCPDSGKALIEIDMALALAGPRTLPGTLPRSKWIRSLHRSPEPQPKLQYPPHTGLCACPPALAFASAPPSTPAPASASAPASAFAPAPFPFRAPATSSMKSTE